MSGSVPVTCYARFICYHCIGLYALFIRKRSGHAAIIM
jgi:hypothetical protein